MATTQRLFPRHGWLGTFSRRIALPELASAKPRGVRQCLLAMAVETG